MMPASQESRPAVIRTTFRDNGRARTVAFVVAAVLLVMFAYGTFSVFRANPATKNEVGTVPPPPHVENIPGGSKSTIYNDLQRQENARLAQQAATAGSTNLPTLVGGNDPNPLLQPSLPSPTATPPVQQLPVQPPVSQAPAPAQIPEKASPPVADQEALNAQYQNTATQLNGYLSAWSVVPAGAQEFTYNGQKPSDSVGAGAAGSSGPNSSSLSAVGASGNGTSASSTSGNLSSGSAHQPSLVRAGTVIPAVLLSAINSDAPGPVLAQIVSGPLAGARLLGQFKANGKTLALTFTVMSKPDLGTLAINAFAVDSHYAVGLATSVDNHYFRRYGLLLAGSLLEGYGQASARANTTVVSGPFGTTTTQGALNPHQIAAAALGQVGTTFSAELLKQSDVKPTVHLDCNGGCPVGLLFMSDL